MPSPYTREKIENWVGDFCASDAIARFGAAAQEFASEVLAALLVAACELRDVEPEDLEEPDLKHALTTRVARLHLPASVQAESPDLCAAFLAYLEEQGRLGGGRALGAYVRALRTSFADAASGKPRPITRPGSRIGRNDPCPCGSGKKYKKCCMKPER